MIASIVILIAIGALVAGGVQFFVEVGSPPPRDWWRVIGYSVIGAVVALICALCIAGIAFINEHPNG